MRRFFFVSIMLLILFSQVAPANAQQPTPSDDEVNAIAKQLYCPICENTPLDVCPTKACADWREQIRQKLNEGWSEQQIKDFFAAQYGDSVLADPPRRGINWLVYLIPAIVIIAGIAVTINVLKNWQHPVEQPVNQQASDELPQSEYIQRLEEELKKRHKT